MRQSRIVMVPKLTGAAYFAATENGAKEAVAELKDERGQNVIVLGNPFRFRTDNIDSKRLKEDFNVKAPGKSRGRHGRQ